MDSINCNNVWLQKEQTTTKNLQEITPTDTVKVEKEVVRAVPEIPGLESLADTTFIRIADYSDDFIYDIRYATTNNFFKGQSIQLRRLLYEG